MKSYRYRRHTYNFNQQMEMTMFNKARIALFVTIVLGTASSAFASDVPSTYSDPDSSPNGPFFYVHTYGVPPATVHHQVQQPHRPVRKRH